MHSPPQTVLAAALPLCIPFPCLAAALLLAGPTAPGQTLHLIHGVLGTQTQSHS